MKQFDYMYFNLRGVENDNSYTLEELKKLGKQGWDIGASFDNSRILLKREIPPGRTQSYDQDGPGY